MPLAPSAPLLAALLAPGLFFQDAPAPAPPAAPAADGPAESSTPDSPETHQILRLPPTGGERRTADRADLAEAAKRVTDLTNAFREKHDLKPVVRNETLAGAAKKFGAYLAKEGLFGHRAGGTTPSQRVEAAGYDFCSVRENLAYHFDAYGFTAEKLADASVTGWINSPGHRANLLADDVTETGVGVVYDEESGRYFSVQLFGLPKSAAVTFEVENRTQAEQTYRVAGREYTLPPRAYQTHVVCSAGPAVVTLGPAPAAPEPGDDPAGDDPADAAAGDEPAPAADDARATELAAGQVLILRPADDGGVSAEVWSPPEEDEKEADAPAKTAAPPAPPAG